MERREPVTSQCWLYRKAMPECSQTHSQRYRIWSSGYIARNLLHAEPTQGHTCRPKHVGPRTSLSACTPLVLDYFLSFTSTHQFETHLDWCCSLGHEHTDAHQPATALAVTTRELHWLHAHRAVRETSIFEWWRTRTLGLSSLAASRLPLVRPLLVSPGSTHGRQAALMVLAFDISVFDISVGDSAPNTDMTRRRGSGGTLQGQVVARPSQSHEVF
jgi:hypothetical protein